MTLEEAKNNIEKQQKHIRLLESIDSLDTVISRLQDLIDKIQSLDEAATRQDTSVKHSAMSLLDLLDNGANMIEESVKGMYARIEELDNLLF